MKKRNILKLSLLVLVSIFFIAHLAGTAEATWYIDGTGGDCECEEIAGQWDSTTNTCTLKQDVAGTIEISADDIIYQNPFLFNRIAHFSIK